MKIQKKILTITIIIFTILIFLNINTQADTPVISPSYITLEDALKGGEPYNQTIYIDNIDDIDHNISISYEGDLQEWIKFYETNITIPITTIHVLKNSYKPITLEITIPKDTANGLYFGNITAIFEESIENQTGAQVKLRSRAKVTINVTGNQVLNATVKGIEISDQEINYPLKIYIDFINTGNVKATPKIDVIIRKNGQIISEFTNTTPDIPPTQSYKYLIKWDTKKVVQSGEYIADFNITLDGKTIKKQNKTFEILSPGTYNRNGTLESIILEGKPEIGNQVKIIATFANTGEIQIDAQFFADILKNGKVINKINSPKITIPIYNKAIFESVFPIEESGEYSIQGYVEYGDDIYPLKWETETKVVTFNVGIIIALEYLLIIVVVAAIAFYLIYIKILVTKKKARKTKKGSILAIFNKIKLPKISLFNKKKTTITKARKKKRKTVLAYFKQINIPLINLNNKKDKKKTSKKSKEKKSTKRHIRIKINKSKSPLKKFTNNSNKKPKKPKRSKKSAKKKKAPKKPRKKPEKKTSTYDLDYKEIDRIINGKYKKKKYPRITLRNININGFFNRVKNLNK